MSTVTASSNREPCDTLTSHLAIPFATASGSLDDSPRVCPELMSLFKPKSADFPAESGDRDGLENRRLAHKNLRLGQVVACRILTVRGEVAERLKAAVC